MAELNVERRKKSPIGWIILGIIVIGLVIWFAASDNDTMEETTAQFDQDQEQSYEYGQEQSQAIPPYDGERGRSEANSRVQEYLMYVENGTDEMSGAEIEEGISKLSDALIAVANEQTQGQDNWSGELEQLKQDAGMLQDNNMNEQHATIIRSAFSSAANIIQNLQNQYYPGLESDASDVMDAAQDIDAQQLASEQSDEIQSFFDEAADILEKMEERSHTTSLDY